MPDEHWERMWELFHQALELEPRRRGAFLEDACRGDDGLREEIEELLASHEKPPSLLQRRERLDAAERMLFASDFEVGDLRREIVGYSAPSSY